MPTFLKFFAWLVVLLGVGFGCFGGFLFLVSNEQWPGIIPAVSAAVATAGVLLALGGHLFTQARELNEARDKRSLFYLESCVKAYAEAQDLLSDGNNDRRTWIAAGRALGHAKALAKDVQQDAHVRVLELHRLKYRKFFQECLEEKSGAFFYGVKGHSLKIQDAAAASTAPIERDGEIITSTRHELDPTSLYAIWEAAQWPASFVDPLEREFTEAERQKLMVLYPGLYEYLEYRKRHPSASGKLWGDSDSG